MVNVYKLNTSTLTLHFLCDCNKKIDYLQSENERLQDELNKFNAIAAAASSSASSVANKQTHANEEENNDTQPEEADQQQQQQPQQHLQQVFYIYKRCVVLIYLFHCQEHQ